MVHLFGFCSECRNIGKNTALYQTISQNHIIETLSALDIRFFNILSPFASIIVAAIGWKVVRKEVWG